MRTGPIKPYFKPFWRAFSALALNACLTIFVTVGFMAEAQAELPSKEEFIAGFKIGKVRCNLPLMLKRAGLTNHQAFQNPPNPQEFEQIFRGYYTEVVYEGLKRIFPINPELAEQAVINSRIIEMDYFCDYTSLRSSAEAFVIPKRFIVAGKPVMNIGIAAFLLAGDAEGYRVSESLNAVWASRYFFHEFLHVYLATHGKFILHTRESREINYGDDINIGGSVNMSSPVNSVIQRI